jgi:hypothetical protein
VLLSVTSRPTMNKAASAAAPSYSVSSSLRMV